VEKWGAVIAVLMLMFGPGIGTSSAEPEAASVALDEVVVTAAQIDGYLEAYPQQVEVMNRLEIQESGYTDLNQVLNAMPGVDVNPIGSGLGSRLHRLGAGKSRTR